MEFVLIVEYCDVSLWEFVILDILEYICFCFYLKIENINVWY